MQLWEKDPEAMNMALKQHDDIFRRYLPAYYGFELATEGGDGSPCSSALTGAQVHMSVLHVCICVAYMLSAFQQLPA